MDLQLKKTQNKNKNLAEQAGITKEYLFKELKRATDNFNFENLLGKGGSALVYKGILEDGTRVAIKKVEDVKYGRLQFETEVKALARLNHVRLVRLRGYCIHVTENGSILFNCYSSIQKEKVFYIVYDYLPHGSLGDCLFKGKGPYLSWKSRYTIANDVADALNYLHHGCDGRRLHLDVKPENILIDEGFRGVLSDFGMSKLLKTDESTVETQKRGTFGYIPPECDDGYSRQSDIFSYGQVLLDIVFGRRYTCLDKDGIDICKGWESGGNSKHEKENFYAFIEKELKGGTIMKHIDSRLQNDENVNKAEVTSLLFAALACLKDDPKERPCGMKEVMDILEVKIACGPLQSVVPYRLSAIVPSYDVFLSREATKKEIMQALMDDNIYLVGVYGIEGVGKTTLIKQVHQQVESANIFNKVVFVTVSEKPNKIQIQNEIAERLGIEITEVRPPIRKNQLFLRLREETKVLLIFDSLFDRLELAQLGIYPCVDSLHTCKVIVISRILSVCASMETTQNIEVRELLESESLKLFRDNVGSLSSIVSDQKSADIAKECEGLPSAILTYASAFRYNDEIKWPEIIKQKRKTLFLGIFYDLQSKFENQLLVLEDVIQKEVLLARSQRNMIHKKVEYWLQNVNEVRLVMENFNCEAEDLKGRSACHHFCEKSMKKLVVIDKLLEEGKSFSSVSSPANVFLGVPQNFHLLESREANKEDIIRALMDDNTNIVGVYGMGGVGKTTLMSQVRQDDKITKTFDKVVLVHVSTNPNLISIQTQIVENLHAKLEEETLSARAENLSELLKREGKILLILDDIWEGLELDEVGIFVSGACKVVITSRCSDVYWSMKATMRAENNIEIKVLSEKDSIELFRSEVGDVNFENRLNIAREIVNECGGLPLAIVTLARALKRKEDGSWEAVTKRLKKSAYKDMDTVNKSIMKSYDFLKTRTTKLCFLLCSLFPEGYRIRMETLIGYAMGEDLLEDVDNLEDANAELYLMVKKLVSSGLLLEGDINGTVMMHDIFRDTAISIARKDGGKSIIKAGLGLDSWPIIINSQHVLRMSLMSNDIETVPDTHDYLELVTLSLASNRLLTRIPDFFFSGMKDLSTLDLSNTGISFFPPSFSTLKSLRSLYLDDCTLLEDLSVIGNLMALEILGLRGTGILNLPENVEKLPNLKMVYT